MKKAFNLLFISLFILLMIGCSNNQQNKNQNNQVMDLSLSENGDYAITTNANRNSYLWNIKAQSYQKVNKLPVNIYSAYFIKGTPYYMYQQDKSKQVIVKDAITGKIIKSFNPGFSVYGQALSKNLNIYAGSEEKEIMHLIKLSNGSHAESGDPDVGFGGAGKLWQPEFTPNDKYIYASSGWGELYIWSTKTGKPIKRIIKNDGQTASTISPNGNYIITGDQGGFGNIYSFLNKNLRSFFYTLKNRGRVQGISQLAFIDQNQFLAFWWSVEQPYMYATLSSIQNMKTSDKFWTKEYLPAIKYLPLVKNPNAQYPSDNGLYPQTQSFLPVVATSPSAHILVMAQANGGGIMVYQYHPEEQTLKLIWAPQLK